VPTELRHADNREFAALSGEVFLGGGRTRQRRIVHQYPVRRQDPDVVAADAAIQETVRDTGRRKSLIREICFFGGRVVEDDMALGNWVDGGEAASIRCLQHEPDG
jgi:hypothetical protein